MKRNTFTLRKTFLKPIANLSDEQRGRLFKAIYQYQCGETPEVTDDIAVCYSFFEAEFAAEEEKRRLRAEKAAERRRQKALLDKENNEKTQAVACEAQSDAEMSKAVESDVKAPRVEAVKVNTSGTVLNSLSVFDQLLEDIPDNGLYFRERHEQLYRAFMKRLRDGQTELYDAGGKNLTRTEFYTLRRYMDDQTLYNYCRELMNVKGWNRDGNTFYRHIMKLYTDFKMKQRADKKR